MKNRSQWIWPRRGIGSTRTCRENISPPVLCESRTATVLMEACGSAHHWGRQIRELGHEVVLISPQYVRPYVPRDKTDRADVKGLLEAYRNTDIRPVPIKTLAQQQLTALHRIRSTEHESHESTWCGGCCGNLAS